MKQMMMVLLLLGGISAGTAANDNSERMAPQAMLAMVSAFFDNSDAVSSDGMAAVDRVMALMHKDMRYLHPEYGADYDYAALLDGYQRRIARASSRNSSTVITNSIAGKNMVAVEHKGSWESKRDGIWVPRAQEGFVTVFEFKDGKIWRVTEYWD